MFVVGGFAESAILQESLGSEFGYKMNVIIPQVRLQSKTKINLAQVNKHYGYGDTLRLKNAH